MVNPNICSEGMAAVTGILLSDISTGTLFDVIAIGSGVSVPDVSNVTLGIYNQSAAATGTQQTTTYTNDTMQLVHTFSFGGSYTITEAGFCNSAEPSLGALLSRGTFTGVAVTAADTLQVTYKIQVKQGT